MYLDVTENYYTIEDDAKFFLKFISQKQGYLAREINFNKIFQYIDFYDVFYARLKTKNPKIHIG